MFPLSQRPPSSYNYNRLPLLAPCHGLLPFLSFFSFMPQTGLESVFPLRAELWAGNTGKRREFRKMCPSSSASPSKSLPNELRQSNAAAAAAAAAGHKDAEGRKRGAHSRVRRHKPGRLCPEVCVRPLVCASLLRSHQWAAEKAPLPRFSTPAGKYIALELGHRKALWTV